MKISTKINPSLVLFLALVFEPCALLYAYLESDSFKHYFTSDFPTYAFDVNSSYEAVCSSVGGQMATITSRKEQALVESILDASNNYWLGLSLDTTTGDWTWNQTGANLGVFENWQTEEPTDTEGNVCALISGANGKWLTGPCSGLTKPVYILCQDNSMEAVHRAVYINSLEHAKKPRSVDFFVIQSVDPNGLLWHDASSRCEQQGGELAVIDSMEEFDIMQSLISETNTSVGYFVGLRKRWEPSHWIRIWYLLAVCRLKYLFLNGGATWYSGAFLPWLPQNASGVSSYCENKPDYHAICERPKTVSVGQQYLLSKKVYFPISKGAYRWDTAGPMCAKFGWRLASVKNQEENDEAVHAMEKANSTANYWTSLRHKRSPSRWEWTDFSNANYENWANESAAINSVKTDVNGHYCVAYRGGKWTPEVSCTRRIQILCEKVLHFNGDKKETQIRENYFIIPEPGIPEIVARARCKKSDGIFVRIAYPTEGGKTAYWLCERKNLSRPAASPELDWMTIGAAVAFGGLAIVVVTIVTVIAPHLKRRQFKLSQTSNENTNSDKKQLHLEASKFQHVPFEIAWEQILIPQPVVLLGKGAFGEVILGRLLQTQSSQDYDVEVAVKTVRTWHHEVPDDKILNCQFCLMKEIELMKRINEVCGWHPNILQMVGYVTVDPDRPAVVTEYCRYGSLASFLFELRGRQSDEIVEFLKASTSTDSGFCSDQLVGGGKPFKMPHRPLLKLLFCYAEQVCSGMAHLASKRILHRDLAARNILLADYTTVKIADFGLSRDVYESRRYVRSGDGPLPFKWMAIESLDDSTYTTASDVWSYGVFLWELATLAEEPYLGIPNNQRGIDVLVEGLQRGIRLERPDDNCPDEFYSMMSSCWALTPSERPSFPVLLSQFEALITAATDAPDSDTKIPVGNRYSKRS